MSKPTLDELLGAPSNIKKNDLSEVLGKAETLKKPFTRQKVENALESPFKKIGKVAIQGINDAGGLIGMGLAKGTEAVLNAPGDLINAFGGNVGKINLPDALKSPTKYMTPGIENTLTGKGIQSASEFVAPGGVAGKAVKAFSPLLKNKKALQNILTGAGTGFLGENSDLGDRTISGALGGALTGGVIGAGKIAKLIKENGINPVSKFTNDFYNKISGGLDTKSLNELNSNSIIKNFNQKKEIGSNKYENWLSEAKKYGFGDDAKIKFDTKSNKFVTQDNNKAVKIEKSTVDSLKNVLFPKKGSEIKNISTELKDLISAFKTNPSLRNAHRLQSKIGQEANDFLSPLSRTTSDIKTAKALNSLKQSINDDIKKNITTSGNEELANMLTDASEYWARNVGPYLDKPTLRRLIIKGEHPSNILNLLTKTDKKGKYDIIREHIAENPAMKDRLLAQVLSKKAKSKIGEKVKTLQIKDAIKEVEKQPDMLKNLFNENSIERIIKLNKKGEFLTNLLKYGLPVAGIEEGVRNIIR